MMFLSLPASRIMKDNTAIDSLQLRKKVEKDEIFFNYYEDAFVINLLESHGFNILEIGKEEYPEEDGSVTMDTFIYADKNSED
jgi:hypothetical protein